MRHLRSGRFGGGGATSQSGSADQTQSQAGSATGGAPAQGGGASAGHGTTAGSAAQGSAGMSGSGSTAGGMAGSTGSGGGGGSGIDPSKLDKFSFFATSMKKMIELGGPKGFGGDLRFGTASGLEGADKIWHDPRRKLDARFRYQAVARLSTEKGGPNDGPIHAKDRIGTGPWYDRVGRLGSINLTNLLEDRPSDADPAIKDDLPNEEGVPNERPDLTKPEDDTRITF